MDSYTNVADSVFRGYEFGVKARQGYENRKRTKKFDEDMTVAQNEYDNGLRALETRRAGGPQVSPVALPQPGQEEQARSEEFLKSVGGQVPEQAIPSQGPVQMPDWEYRQEQTKLRRQQEDAQDRAFRNAYGRDPDKMAAYLKERGDVSMQRQKEDLVMRNHQLYEQAVNGDKNAIAQLCQYVNAADINTSLRPCEDGTIEQYDDRGQLINKFVPGAAEIGQAVALKTRFEMLGLTGDTSAYHADRKADAEATKKNAEIDKTRAEEYSALQKGNYYGAGIGNLARDQYKVLGSSSGSGSGASTSYSFNQNDLLNSKDVKVDPEEGMIYRKNGTPIARLGADNRVLPLEMDDEQLGTINAALDKHNASGASPVRLVSMTAPNGTVKAAMVCEDGGQTFIAEPTPDVQGANWQPYNPGNGGAARGQQAIPARLAKTPAGEVADRAFKAFSDAAIDQQRRYSAYHRATHRNYTPYEQQPQPQAIPAQQVAAPAAPVQTQQRQAIPTAAAQPAAKQSKVQAPQEAKQVPSFVKQQPQEQPRQAIPTQSQDSESFFDKAKEYGKKALGEVSKPFENVAAAAKGVKQALTTPDEKTGVSYVDAFKGVSKKLLSGEDDLNKFKENLSSKKGLLDDAISGAKSVAEKAVEIGEGAAFLLDNPEACKAFLSKVVDDAAAAGTKFCKEMVDSTAAELEKYDKELAGWLLDYAGDPRRELRQRELPADQIDAMNEEPSRTETLMRAGKKFVKSLGYQENPGAEYDRLEEKAKSYESEERQRGALPEVGKMITDKAKKAVAPVAEKAEEAYDAYVPKEAKAYIEKGMKLAKEASDKIDNTAHVAETIGECLKFIATTGEEATTGNMKGLQGVISLAFKHPKLRQAAIDIAHGDAKKVADQLTSLVGKGKRFTEAEAKRVQDKLSVMLDEQEARKPYSKENLWRPAGPGRAYAHDVESEVFEQGPQALATLARNKTGKPEYANAAYNAAKNSKLLTALGVYLYQRDNKRAGTYVRKAISGQPIRPLKRNKKKEK